MKVIAVVILAILGVVALAHYRPVHDCSMLAKDCASHYAVWVPNMKSVSTYGKCACAATLIVHGS